MTDAASWTFVCHRDDIVPNTGVCAKVGEAQVAVFRVVAPNGDEDGVFAIDNFDVRSQANVLSRGLIGELSTETGPALVVASPVYKNHLCLRTGRCLEDEAWSVKAWAVACGDDGAIMVRAS
ncbi:nitrite reductase small subunit NirD [Nevskia ramosa]|uniref:nitrite reductase small subunit NirD n=1 Tax=Nevskia ramosa TaxID=64002 RepID=UPI002354770D|nr:nitrite reductase small subunit NirD [Nevskia ramosa]